jgi:hypothetical protein
MKKLYILILFTFCIGKQTFSQTPKVYINLNSHNEASEGYAGATRALYDSTYKYIKIIADTVISKKAKYNFQSDVSFLFGCLKWDLKAATTNSLNLLKWMDDSPYIECDPHSHEGKYPSFGPLAKYYNYSDCAHLHDSLGVTNRKNVGGFKVDGLQNLSNWPDFEAGQQGVAYSTSGLWKPNVLWGGSYKTGVHNDMHFFGTYKPMLDTSLAENNTTNTSQRLRIQGNGCDMVFHDSTSEQRIIRELSKLFKNVHYGVYANSEFYTPVLQFNCRDVAKVNYVNRLFTILDSVNTYVNLGWVEWRTISEKDSIWKASPLDSVNKRINCANLPTGIKEQYISNGLGVYPNPVLENLIVAHTMDINSITITDILGEIVFEEKNIDKERAEIKTDELKSGIYFVSVYLNNNITLTRKIIKE